LKLRVLANLSDVEFQTIRDRMLAAIQKRASVQTGNALYDKYLDLDSNGVINITDLIKARNAMNSTRPVPSITVLSPNGGENWVSGSTQKIEWKDSYTGCTTNSAGISVCELLSAPRMYNITLSNYLSCWTANPACMAPAVLYQIATSVIGSTYSWTVGKDKNGNDIPAGQYKVTVSSAGSPSVTDQSDSAFTITEITTQPATTSLNPEAVNAIAEFSQKKNLNLASILAAIERLIAAFAP
ncbi:MAG: hypothetical protein AAB808_01700, partial [Patescibacteria group bacterium]